MNRPTALALIAVLWAGIYLPGLGSTEIKGEEGRRILPAVTMLETGNWLVPYVGGKPFLRKPPLVNWAIAGMFKLTGVRNEWTARLPAALCVLALGLMIVAVSGAGWITVETSVVAALMAMTQAGLLAKARFAGAEIEGIYAPLSGMAMVLWLAWRARGVSPWLLWTAPAVLLGLACLAKGPSLHLLFYYVVVIAVLWRAKALRELLHPAHFLGIAVVAGIFAAWAVPYFQTPEAAGAAEVWKRQGIDRFTDSEFNAVNWMTNIPRALLDQLPWLLLLPMLLRRRRLSEWISGSCLPIALAVCFAAVLLVPGTLPRYVLPLGAPFALLLAAAWCEGKPTRPLRLTVGAALLASLAMAIYAVFAVPRINEHDDIRPVAAAIDAALPPGAHLTIYDPSYLPAIFYLRTPYRYAPFMEDIPADAGWVLARSAARRKFEEKRPELRVFKIIEGKGKSELLLLQRAPDGQKVAAPSPEPGPQERGRQ